MKRNHHRSKPTSPAQLLLASALAAALVALGALLRQPDPGFTLVTGAQLRPAAWSAQPHAPRPDTDAAQDAPEGVTECVITLMSGRTIKGELIDRTAETVVIGIDGIDTTFQRRNITEIKILPPVAHRYRQMRDAIDDDNIDARLSLVEWLRARKAFALALSELESILEFDPGNPQAKLLHRWLAEHLKLINSGPAGTGAGTSPETEQGDEKPEDRQYRIERNDLEPLDENQLDLMRVYEIDLSDPPQLRVSDEIIRTLIERYPNAFSPDEERRQTVFEMSEIEKLRLLFSLKARDLYPKVEVLEEPHSLNLFRENVHHGRGWIINACASTRCHGGVEAGSFRLLNTRPNSPETAYTNLYIIENTTLADGTPLLDFNDPRRSPLLQMAMLDVNSLRPHPEIPRDYPGRGLRPVFRTTRDRKYRQAVDWIRSMYQPRPDYGFQYPPQEPESDPDSPEPRSEP